MSRSVQTPQKHLSDEEKCDGGICKSNDSEWTQFCDKHKKELDKHTARWAYYHRTGIDLNVNEEVPNGTVSLHSASN